MPKSKLQTFASYQFSPRGVLHEGDRFRVAGGPTYTSPSGKRIPLYDRGVFVFCRYYEQGAARWIEAHREGESATVILRLSKATGSSPLTNLRRRPYRVTAKVRAG